MSLTTDGGVALKRSEEGKNGWELKVAVGAPSNGVRSVEINANKSPGEYLLLAARLKDFTYSMDMPITGEFKGQIRPLMGSDLFPARLSRARAPSSILTCPTIR